MSDDFEVFPHYDEATQKDLLEKYRLTAKHEVREITNENYITLDF